MTSQARIQANVWKGYAKAARRLGAEYRFYRPGPPDTDLGLRLASVNPEDMTYSRPDRPGKPGCYVLTDGTGLRPGDYFSGPDGTYFIASLSPLLPILAVQCNATVRVTRPQGATDTGAQGYGGRAAETLVLAAAPASIQPDRQGKAPLSGLPAEAQSQPTWKVLLKLPKGLIQKRDVLTDELGVRYQAVYADWGPVATTVLAVQLNGPGTPAVPVGGWEALPATWESLAAPWAPPAFPQTPWGGSAPWDALADPWALPSGWDAAPSWNTASSNWESFG